MVPKGGQIIPKQRMKHDDGIAVEWMLLSCHKRVSE